MEIILKNQIKKIIVHKQKPIIIFHLVKRKVRIGFFKRKEQSFVSDVMGVLQEVPCFLERFPTLFIEDNIIYQKPFCKIITDENPTQVNFETDEELDEYIKKLLVNKPHIKIEENGKIY